MSDERDDLILSEVRGHLCVITINRPEARNAFDGATAHQMETVVDRFEEDPALRVAILTGSGKTFCSGQDLKAAAVGDIGATKRRGGFGIMGQPPKKPVIAAVEGYAVAGGMELCLACDLIVASREARFGIPEVRHNLCAVGGALFRLPKRIPYHLAMELALTAETPPAELFHRFGLVNRLTDPGQALDGAIELAERICENGPLAVAASAQVIRQSVDWSEHEAWRKQLELTAPIRKSRDTQEGLRAFAEKRKPVWEGR